MAPNVDANSHKEDDEGEGEEFALEEEVLEKIPKRQRRKEEEKGNEPEEALFPKGVPCRSKRGEKGQHGFTSCVQRERSLRRRASSAASPPFSVDRGEG